MDGADLFGILAGPAPVPSDVSQRDDRPQIVDSFAGGGGASTGIKLCSLTSRNQINTQAFPTDDEIDGYWQDDGDPWPFNSVSPPLAEALVRVRASDAEMAVNYVVSDAATKLPRRHVVRG